MAQQLAVIAPSLPTVPLTNREKARFKRERGPRGGVRPGAGRPTNALMAYQTNMRELIRLCIDENEVREVIASIIDQAKKGNPVAIGFFIKYVFGTPPDEVKMKIDIETRIRMIATTHGLDPDLAVDEAMAVLQETTRVATR